MTKTYKSKIGIELIIFLMVIFGISFYGMIVDKSWFGIIFLFVLCSFIILCGLVLRYEISENNLTIRSGFIRHQKVPIQTIRKIVETNNPLSAPAFSLDRLEIIYNKFDSVLISPKDKKGFIVHLTNLNPEIEVKLKKGKNLNNVSDANARHKPTHNS